MNVEDRNLFVNVESLFRSSFTHQSRVLLISIHFIIDQNHLQVVCCTTKSRAEEKREDSTGDLLISYYIKSAHSASNRRFFMYFFIIAVDY